MKIEKNKVVSLLYQLSENDQNGNIIEAVDESRPFTFLFGNGQLIPGFENNVANMSVGESFGFQVLPEDGYGTYEQENIADLPISIFMRDGKVDTEILKVGNMVPLQDDKGHVFHGMVKEIGLEKVNIDFNHPLAGKTLFFSGKILEVRDASEEELAHGHVHGPNGHQH
ncbi:MAG: peptidylprolyl isomerase [Bacteroidales bacterium]|jgi:FKBP-type peptidyl-prolyl cis-trans isomerase SlyD|nr:peptidylprolyl isomerase [Bacteroidales bacterium]HPB01949.1 peptidylprolyl isomerase [Bacteroidales bacterium]